MSLIKYFFGFFLFLPLFSFSQTCPTTLNFTFPRLQDEVNQDLCQYKGKVVLVVNTASYCGFTSQYEGLEKTYAKYATK
jgi:glutathione peroxidase